MGVRNHKIVLMFCNDPAVTRSSDPILIMLVKISCQPEAKKETNEVTFSGFKTVVLCNIMTTPLN